VDKESRGRGRALPPLERIAQRGAVVLEKVRRLGLGDWLRAEREEWAQTVKVTIACVVAWWLAAGVMKVPMPVLAPIGVLATVSVTAYSTVVRGAQQIGAVVVGVSGAIGIILVIGVNAVTLTVLVASGLVLTRLLNLPKQNVQIPITALLVMQVGSTSSIQRLIDLMLGVGVGIAANLLVLPPRYIEEAQQELSERAADLAELARDVGEGLRGVWGEEEAREWLERARELSRDLDESEEVAEQAVESVRLTVRRRRYQERLDQVAEAMTALDHACQSLRSITRALIDLVVGARGLPAKDAALLPVALGDELDAIARAFAAFGGLQTSGGNAMDMAALRQALRDGEQEDRLVADTFKGTEHVGLWSLYGGMLDQCLGIRYELDPDNGPHRAAFPPDFL
jgi:uncharacterized membrane protein YgaE (UPF0421/DUF939 family)